MGDESRGEVLAAQSRLVGGPGTAQAEVDHVKTGVHDHRGGDPVLTAADGRARRERRDGLYEQQRDGVVLRGHGAPHAHGLDQETEHSITDVARLRTEILHVRQRGWATTSQEHHAGAWGLAVPVTGEDHRVVAALGIVALSEI
ncbi:IclR family transcriptional regulator domain-containing protein [Kocuria sp.]|uniref:IclR family transcriptional regulator domain-containing protein n=2 Tax=Kocuria TaxID=57493 RepID=UPI0025BADF20|nr:IclR family transcriptional regulator C-terminal domain-containing protein [Kocuria sp.]